MLGDFSSDSNPLVGIGHTFVVIAHPLVVIGHTLIVCVVAHASGNVHTVFGDFRIYGSSYIKDLSWIPRMACVTQVIYTCYLHGVHVI